VSGGAGDTIDVDRRTSQASRAEWVAPLLALTVAMSVLSQRLDAMLVTAGAVAVIAALVAWIAWQDVRTLTISDAALLALAILAVTMRLVVAREAGGTTGSTLVMTAFDGAVPGGLLLLFREFYYRRKGFDGLGLGDVKLAAVGGLLVGMVGFSWALFAASLLGLLVVVGLRVRSKRKPDRFDRLPFGAVLAPAVFVVWLLQLWSLQLPVVGF
jgi:leader peptidase (prepilin peptidase)/N-methyltransferase